MKTGKIVLFFPPYAGKPLSPPAGVLAIASPLLAAGHRVSIVDGSLDPDFAAAILRETAGALCLGISLFTGPMIRTALEVARRVRRAHPALPIIFGGWHPSLTPGQTLQSELVDVVARGQGELTLLEIAQRLSQGEDLAGVRGVSWKRDGEVVHNPERPVENVNNLPAPAYHLADIDAYERVCGARRIGYPSSVGCPYACNYCTDMVFYSRRFNAYRAGRVVGEVIELVERYRLQEVVFLDSNFPVDLKRAVEIARGFAAGKVKFAWKFQASTDFLSRMSDEDVCLLAESGVHHVGFGTESASPEVLALMNKKHQRLNEMFETARKSHRAGIKVTFNLIFGYPGETEADRLETLRIMSDVARQYPNVTFSPNIFTPYPGLPIWPQLKELGVREPQSLEEWADLPLGRNVLPWLQGEELLRLQRMLEFFLLDDSLRSGGSRVPWLGRRARLALGSPLRWRLRNNRFGFPWELWVARTAERLITRRSLITGQALSHSMQDVC
jgi:anaerobic magnesium-protoporphyrin IX monomethyl ester cyclase